jgi:hypothetical protein
VPKFWVHRFTKKFEDEDKISQEGHKGHEDQKQKNFHSGFNSRTRDFAGGGNINDFTKSRKGDEQDFLSLIFVFFVTFCE